MEKKSNLNSHIDDPKDLTKIFGDWIKDPIALQKKFIEAKPYSFIKIKNFLNHDLAEKLADKFPTPVGDAQKHFHRYCNPLENKWAMDNVLEFPEEFRFIFEALSTSDLCKKMGDLTNIKDLEHDPTLNGSGLHCHGRNGNLAIHLDCKLKIF